MVEEIIFMVVVFITGGIWGLNFFLFLLEHGKIPVSLKERILKALETEKGGDVHPQAPGSGPGIEG